ncbi:unnamed protein product [Malus baccata var. baccata]
MAKDLNIFSIVHLKIGVREFCTTVDTLTRREPNSMLAAMFSGRHVVHQDPETGYVFIDRDGKHFRHILNWLRDGVVPSPEEFSKYSELVREAEYYQLLGLRDIIQAFLNKRKDDDQNTEKLGAELTRIDIIKSCIKSNERIRLRGVNLSGLNLSNLDLTNIDFSYACLRNVCFKGCDLRGSNFNHADAEGAIFQHASLQSSEFIGANLRNALFVGANLYNANLISAELHGADLTNANLEAASLDKAYLMSCEFGGANLCDALFVDLLTFTTHI